MKSKKVFIAHDAFCAFIDRGHPKHMHAAAYFHFLAQEEYQLFTDTNQIMDVYKKIYDGISPSLARDFLRILTLSTINIIYPDESDIRAAIKTLINYRSTELIFSESLMAVLANRRSIPQIYTFDYLHSLFGLTLFYLPI